MARFGGIRNRFWPRGLSKALDLPEKREAAVYSARAQRRSWFSLAAKSPWARATQFRQAVMRGRTRLRAEWGG